MKVAIFHNFMDNIGGAEIVTLTMARGLDADIYTTNISTEKIIKMGFADVLPRIYSIGKIPIKAPFRHQLAFWKFRRLNLGNKYERYIISGDWAMSGAVNHHPNMWYVHSPLNELWAFRDYIKENILTFWQRPIYDLWVFFNRALSKRYSQSVDQFVCNSNNTKERLLKYYGKNGVVVYPPVDTEAYKWEESEGYWLSVNRLVKSKRIEIQIEAFRNLPNERLVIVGSYEKGADQFENYRTDLEKDLPSNVQILNWVEDKELKRLYARCKGFITTALNEDFGMTVVEAMASGKPVIAPNEGGYRESVVDGVNGVVVDEMGVENLVEAINRVNESLTVNEKYYKRNCEEAKRFDTMPFIRKILKSIYK